MSDQHAQTNHDVPEDATYEQLVEFLEASVARLESGELSLEQAVMEYERGMHLVERCNKMLDSAELRVTELSSRTNTAETESWT